MSRDGISIIVCTRNHASSLAETLATINNCDVVSADSVELLVADNGSTDATEQIIKGASGRQISTRSVRMETVGKGYAYNAAIRVAKGGTLLFTDDDVRVPTNWITEMCGPILSGQFDALAGGVRIAEHLLKPWMTPYLKGWFASTDWLNRKAPEELVGANMAIRKSALLSVNGFDTALGPGALGFADDSLVAYKLHASGYRIGARFDVEVEHHFEESRLRQNSLRDIAVRAGRSQAYLAHHWHQQSFKLPRIRAGIAMAARLCHPTMSQNREGISQHEFEAWRRASYFIQYVREIRHRPKYAEWRLNRGGITACE